MSDNNSEVRSDKDYLKGSGTNLPTQFTYEISAFKKMDFEIVRIPAIKLSHKNL